MEANIHPNCKCRIIDGEFILQEDACDACHEAKSEYAAKQKFGVKGKLKKLNEDSLPCYEIVVNDDDETGIALISLVDEPAIMMKGMAFADSSIMSFKEVGDKQMIVGPALIPNMRIYREDEKHGQYYVVFTEATIEKMVEKFNKFGSNRRINIDHSNQMVDAFICEDWIVEDEVYDKSRKYGFEVPKGTYMIKVKIEDSDFWNSEVKGNGKFGFSIEGMLGQQLISMSAIDSVEVEMESYSDYPEAAKNAAKRALKWAEEHGWGSCGTPVGKARANQLAKGEPISRETISRMAGFARHAQNKDVPYSEGCGGLMWDAWGGTAGIEWAQRKLREIDKDRMESVSMSKEWTIDDLDIDDLLDIFGMSEDI